MYITNEKLIEHGLMVISLVKLDMLYIDVFFGHPPSADSAKCYNIKIQGEPKVPYLPQARLCKPFQAPYAPKKRQAMPNRVKIYVPLLVAEATNLLGTKCSMFFFLLRFLLLMPRWTQAWMVASLVVDSVAIEIRSCSRRTGRHTGCSFCFQLLGRDAIETGVLLSTRPHS